LNEYLLTKYNPQSRNPSGAYMLEEWTSFGDIGRSFGEVELTRVEYERVEDAYIAVAIEFLREAEIPQLTVRGLENARGEALPFVEGDSLTLDEIPMCSANSYVNTSGVGSKRPTRLSTLATTVICT
jgi:hypothetical protein